MGSLFPLGIWELTALCAAVFFFILAAVWAVMNRIDGGNREFAPGAAASGFRSEQPAPSQRSMGAALPTRAILGSSIPASDEIRQLYTHLRYFLLTMGDMQTAVLETQERCAIVAESMFRQYNLRSSLPAGKSEDVLRHALSMRALSLEYDAALIEQTMESVRENQNRMHELLNAYKLHWEAVAGTPMPADMAYGDAKGRWMAARPYPELSQNILVRRFSEIASGNRRGGAWRWICEHYQLPLRNSQFPRDRERVDVLMTDAACYDRLAEARVIKGPPSAVREIRGYLGRLAG